MDTNQLAGILDHSNLAVEWLKPLGLKQPAAAAEDIRLISQAGVTADLMAVICSELESHLARLPDPDLALNTLRRFVESTRSPLSFAVLVEQDPSSLVGLLKIFSCSPNLGDRLVADPEAFDLLRMTAGQPTSRRALVDEIKSEIQNLGDRQSVLSALRRYATRETLRIAYGDLVQAHGIVVVNEQLSWLADAICEGALLYSTRELQRKLGRPLGANRNPSRFVVLGLDALGGLELDYSAELRLMLLFEAEGKTDGPNPTKNSDYYEKLSADFLKLVADPADLTAGYQVDLSLRPKGPAGPLAISVDEAARHYDMRGRTWERQAFIKARPVAGDLELGESFCGELQPWIYRRYLNRADITGIKALKRRIERHAESDRSIWSGAGGTRDISTVVQFLQLLNGGDLPQVRTGNTLEAIDQLRGTKCLTDKEADIIRESFISLRRIQHLSQVMFDASAQTIPEDDVAFNKLAFYVNESHPNDSAELRSQIEQSMSVSQKVLDSLLSESFGEDGQTNPAVDLVLDPEPTAQAICDVLQGYGFKRLDDAYQSLSSLADEQIPFLSTRRCRHFLANIVPSLLDAISQTPDADATLARLREVSDSIGGKGVLWELFHHNPPSLSLYVRLCAACPYLSRILTTHPGMIDELMDSLMLSRLPSIELLKNVSNELVRYADDLHTVLVSFKNAQHLNVGVRDILGKDDVRSTNRALSNIAEVCLTRVVQQYYDELVARYGQPCREEDESDESSLERVELVVLALGKLGGQEPNYHSTLDIMMLYEADGMTSHPGRDSDNRTTTNQHFFSELAQKVTKFFNRLGTSGKLYEFDVTLRAQGASGLLAMSFDSFRDYYSSKKCSLSSRQALCKARPILGIDNAKSAALCLIHEAIFASTWDSEDTEQLRAARQELEKTAASKNLKRGFGGTIDVEYGVQALQLRNASAHPAILVPGTIDAIEQLQVAGIMSNDEATAVAESYRFLRSVEARLRLMNTTARHDLPGDQTKFETLAYLLQISSSELADRYSRYTKVNREFFERSTS